MKEKYENNGEVSSSRIAKSDSSRAKDRKLIFAKMKHHCGPSFDRLSELPSNIIDIILMFLPLREIVRTSILSRNWRFQWTSVPQLIFDHDLMESKSPKERNRLTIDKVFEILLKHEGPISKFTLDVIKWPSSSEVDQIISVLSSNGIEDFTLVTGDKDRQQLTSTIFSCVELKHLSLFKCVFQPLTLVGFQKLITAELMYIELDPNVSIPCGPLLKSLKLIILSKIDFFKVDGPSLKSFFFEGSIFNACEIFAPLKVLSLTGIDEGDIINGEFDLINLLRSLPLLENLHLSLKFRQLLREKLLGSSDEEGDVSSEELFIVLNNLRMLELQVLNLYLPVEQPFTLWLTRSSPNLEKLIIEIYQETDYDPIEVEYNTDYSLTNLREIEVLLRYDWSEPKLDREFFKFLLAITPNLETLYIKPIYMDIHEDVVNGYRILFELACLPRASPKAEIVYLTT